MGRTGINISSLVSNGTDILLIKRANNAAVIPHLLGSRVILPNLAARISPNVHSPLFIRRDAIGDRLSFKLGYLNGLMGDRRILP
ncbi:hypothetical protein D1872_327990 [compost metagenome]